MTGGDLVQLSGYGVTRGFNRQLTIDYPEQTGLIIDIQKGSYPYIIRWSKVQLSGGLNHRHHRRELKYAGR